MKIGTKGYVGVVGGAAVLAAAALVAIEPAPSSATLNAVILLSCLALVAEMMAFMLSKSVTGSIAFIPYLASIIVAPSWLSLVGVTCVRLIAERKREPIKAFFNLAQHSLTFCLTALVFRGLGGIPLLELGSKSILDATTSVGVQAVVAIIFSVALNSFLVSGVIASSTNQPARIVWRENYLSTIGLDVLATPVIVIFAWVYVSYGAIAAATIWVPILGLRQFHKANLELERTNRELLELMVKSIEARDPYTSGHSRRVQQYSIVIARALGLPERTVERVGRAALLHDVGKIHEKYAPILRNPNRLSAEEWLVMKEHPADGAELVATVSGLRDLVGAIRGHHEAWDGSGYPDGFRAESIPLEARIISFADTIDAMTSERSYRPALGEPQVRVELIRARGTQFDPSLCDRILAPQVWNALFPAKVSRTGVGLALMSSATQEAV